MSETLYISVEGLETSDWLSKFSSKLLELIPDEPLIIFTPRTPGGVGGGKKNLIGIRNIRAVNLNTVASIISSIILAASLAIANPSSGGECSCTIKGENGSITLQVSGSHEMLIETLNSCIKEIGLPKEIKVIPDKRDDLKAIK